MEKDLNQDNLKNEADTNEILDKPKKENETTQDDKGETNLDEKIKLLEDKVARTLAEMENQRRRFEKEKEDAFEYGGFAFAREALNLIDNLDRAKQSLSNDEKIKNSDVLEKILEHLEILNTDLISIFKKNNIEPIDSIDKKLDPNLHQAMMEVEDEVKEPGTIIQEIQKGFTIKDRLLRPALVGVSKKPSKQDDKNHQNDKKIKDK
tara:strand:+ start:9921 stop:10541 length:621 start_codon:yes stop_codon:yes gene_type:complete